MNTIRRAEKKDISKVLELLVQVNMVHHNGRPDLFKDPATKYTQQELETIFADENTPVFVSVNEEDVVEGYSFCILKQLLNDHILTDVKTLYIDDICIDENCRGKHIGSQIFEYVKNYAKNIGCYNVTLNVWSCNSGAMKFYEKCGLVPQKTGMEMIL